MGDPVRLPRPLVPRVRPHPTTPVLNMLDAAKLLTFTLVAAFVTVAAALSVPQAVFERSCEACPEEAFCEFAFPGAASDEVACVSYPKNRRSALYKRYNDPPPFNCNIL